MNESLNQPIQDVAYRDKCVTDFSGLKSELEQSGTSVQVWTDAPGTHHSPHDHPYSHRVLTRTGWIEFTVDNETYRLEPGDTLDLPERVTHEANSHPGKSTEYWLIRP